MVKKDESCYKSLRGSEKGPRARCIFNPNKIIKAVAGFYNYYLIKLLKTVKGLGFV